MTYNLSIIAENSTTGLLGFTQGTSSVLLNDGLGILLLVGISAILFIGFMRTTGSFEKTIMATSFIAFVLSVLLRLMSLVTTPVMITCLVLAAICIGFINKETF